MNTVGNQPEKKEVLISAKDQDRIQKELLEAKALLQKLKDNNKILTFKPLPHQQRVLNMLGTKSTILMQGANRIGKTALGANISGAAVSGYFPWTEGHIPTPWGKEKIKVRIICVDWEHHAKEVVVEALKEWLPRGSYQTRKNNMGVEAFWIFPKTGSTIELLTHIQETKIHEGWKGHLVWADEPLPKDKYIANKRGLIDYGGTFLMTMTAVYEPWILDDIALSDDPSVGVVQMVPMDANTYISKAHMDEFSRTVEASHREARVLGKWLQLHGLVLKSFNKDFHVVDDFKVPYDWPMVAMIDLHLSTEQAVGFYGWDRYNREFVVDEFFEHMGPEEIADEIVRRVKLNNWNLKKAFIDPLSKGDTAYVKNRGINIEDSFRIIEKRLSPYGIRLEVASKDKASGIRNLENLLIGPNKIPGGFIQRKCKRHIWEAMRWCYEEDTNKPVKENDHMMENWYRSTLTGVKYGQGFKMTSKFNKPPKGIV